MTKYIQSNCIKKPLTTPEWWLSRGNPNSLPCPQCGSQQRKVGAGKAPHYASLRCGECDRFIKWIGKSELVKLNQGGQN